ncbi:MULTISPECIES: hypothetical protein [unclassified Nostoc]|uniref:hypothetical protein n=1 Tax=unclassified Nostoc TaxID=2593658 RepID=UPI002AD22215|nr:hypothetical protein [Nostoc sp. DedQUE03]MDZ7975763.1 hypothetical protein [Nostoc sp. DedQUE03]MDZ8048296.1 hypothetical protein [Nostoc sp. DedQUE02]
MAGKGGRRGTTWNSQWNHGNTKHIRVPVALEQQIMEFARALDCGQVPLDREVLQKTILLLIDRYVEQRIAEFHPNQYSSTGSTTSRRWDELRRFRTAIALHHAADESTLQSPEVSVPR